MKKGKPVTDFDTILAGGRIIDPAAGLDIVGDVGIIEGRVAAVGLDLSARAARETRNVEECLVVPGLIDLHGHFVPDVHPMALEADAVCPPSGITTAVDAGTVGWPAYPSLVRQIERQSTQMVGFIHLSMIGLVTAAIGLGELFDPRLIVRDKTLETLLSDRERLLGLKVRVTEAAFSSVDDARSALRVARDIVDEAGCILMLHVSGSPLPISEVLAHVRAGDIITHAYHGTTHGILDADFKVREEVWRARQDGVIFDVGHAGIPGDHFSLEVAQRAVEDGFWPDTISTDIHRARPGSRSPSMLEILETFIGLGMPLPELVAAVTERPARAIRIEDGRGTLRTGAPADIAVLRLSSADERIQLKTELTLQAGEITYTGEGGTVR